MSERQYRDVLFALVLLMSGWLLGTDVATDFQAAGNGSPPDMWFGVYETLAILGISAIAGIVGYLLDGFWWAGTAFTVIATMQFVGLFDPEIMINDSWTDRLWVVVALGVTAIAFDKVKTWYEGTEADSPSKSRMAQKGGSMEDM